MASRAGRAFQTTVDGDFLGVAPDGKTAEPNGKAGIAASASAVGNTIGGTTDAAANLISGDTGDGVDIAGSNGDSIEGNVIGASATLGSLPNGSNGVYLYTHAASDVVGGAGAGAANLIAYNGAAGVLVGSTSSDGVHVAIEQSDIYSNGGLGIDLAPAGTVNCSGAGSPNDYTPCPVVQSASTGSVSGTACGSCRVEVFVGTNEADDQGHGEGLRYVGFTNADAGGNWSLSPPSGALNTGQYVTAAATTPAAAATPETSEFAANVFIPVPVTNGWSLVTTPVHINTIDNPGETFIGLIESLEASLGNGAVQAIATYVDGQFHVFANGFSANGPVAVGQGFFVLSNQSGNWFPEGDAFTTGQTAVLRPGWNLVGAPYPPSALRADQIAQEIDAAGGQVSEIASYSPAVPGSQGGYTTWTPQSTSTPPFLVPPSSGMWIDTATPATWTPH